MILLGIGSMFIVESADIEVASHAWPILFTSCENPGRSLESISQQLFISVYLEAAEQWQLYFIAIYL